jgi:hypothetical protein
LTALSHAITLPRITKVIEKRAQPRKGSAVKELRGAKPSQDNAVETGRISLDAAGKDT